MYEYKSIVEEINLQDERNTRGFCTLYFYGTRV